MSDQIPFLLHEAVLTLYPAGPDGLALTDVAVWSGALANRFRARMDLDEVKVAASGDAYTTAYHIDEEHVLEISRTWILRKQFLSDFMPARNQQYVLDLVFYASGYWYRRTYLGVTGRSIAWDSQGTNQFLVDQTWRAQRFTQDGGQGRPPVFTPLPAGDVQSVAFFREDVFVVGEYLVGHYRWPVAARLVSATCIAAAGQDTDTVLTLEVGGVLTAKTITLPAGDPNTEVSVEVSLSNYSVTAGQNVRWKITSGPIPEAAPWMAALTMEVLPDSDQEPISFFHEQPVVTGDYLLGEYVWAGTMQLLSAIVSGYAPQNSPVAFTLEIDGVLQPYAFTLPIGTANTEVTNSIDLGSLQVAAGQSVRWKVTGAPAAEYSAWKVALTLQAVPV